MNEKRLLAGAAKREITPDQDLLPLPFAGPVSLDFVKDRIYVRALSLESAGNKILIMTFDMGEVPYPKEMRGFIQELTGLPEEAIFLAGTHTHETPFMGFGQMPAESKKEMLHRRYFEKIKEAAREAVLEAEKSKCEAKIGLGKGNSYINVNRDEIVEGKAAVGNNYERPSDKTLCVIRVETMENKLVALLVNYAVHGVFLNGNFVDGKLCISGDIPGQTSALLEEKLGGVALWTSGAAGDQNPRVLTNFGFADESGSLKTKCVGEGAYYIFDSLVEEHVRDILKVNDSIKCEQTEQEIQAFERTVPVEGREEQPVPYLISMLQIGGIHILGINAEVATTIGEAIRNTSDAVHTILVTHVQGSMGYVCDDWQYEHQTFETGMAAAKKGAAEPAFTKAFLELMEERNKERDL